MQKVGLKETLNVMVVVSAWLKLGAGRFRYAVLFMIFVYHYHYFFLLFIVQLVGRLQNWLNY